MITTAWGRAELVEEASVLQTNEERAFTTHVQLLSNEEGEQLLRFAYSTDDLARRGPVTMRVSDVKKLAKGLERTPKLHALLKQLTVKKRSE